MAKEIQRQNLSQRIPFKNRIFTRALQRMEEHERRRNSAPVSQPKLAVHTVRGDWTRRQSAVEAPYHPELDPVTERQQILESILRTTRWPTTNNIAVMQDNPQQFSQPLSSPVKAKDVPESKDLNVEKEATIVSWDEHNRRSEPKFLENEEWAEFLDSTLEDAIDNPQTLIHRNLVAVIVVPLRNVSASPNLVERIATLLAIPWAGTNDIAEEALIRAYVDTRVVPNLLYACKVMVQRRSGTNCSTGSGELGEEEKKNDSELTADDLQSLEMLLGLVCRLVHLTATTDFIDQFCDAICVLDCSMSIHSLFLVDRRKAHAVCHILAILSHVLRTRSENVSVVQDILTKKHTDLLRLLSNRTPLIRSRCCTLLGYLALRGTEKLKEMAKQPAIVDRIEQLLDDPDPHVHQSATFAYQLLRNCAPTLENTGN